MNEIRCNKIERNINDKRMKVFLASTTFDLMHHKEAAMEAIDNIGGKPLYLFIVKPPQRKRRMQ